MTDIDPWAEIVGPCYTRAALMRVLEWTEDELSTAVAALEILEVTTSDEVVLYPAFQVWEGRIMENLGAVLQVLSTGTGSAWTWVQWLNSPLVYDGVEQPKNIDRLRQGQLDDLLLEARHDAAAWRS
ncbi:hypothetical protein M4D51_02855 [Microbacterium sp. p3-SID338]|uniref:hypothetical protein n=1 Tax=Microbacterium sp. p3-SID338 TaxID=2916214 RepID=UPI0021A57A68|nr:hypothetical protein [Microbacterium sp. p3-SID338]MCT1394659.1 hypothetical protein [Microbacterium sp. p3-SID338]